MAQIEQALTAMQQRCAPGAERQAAGVVHEDVSCEPMRPAALPRAYGKIALFTVAFAKDIGIEDADIAQAIAAYIETKAYANGDLDIDPGVRRCGKSVKGGRRLRLDVRS